MYYYILDMLGLVLFLYVVSIYFKTKKNKKKKLEEPKKSDVSLTKKLAYKEEFFNSGIVEIKVYFQDGGSINTFIEGHIDQYVHVGYQTQVYNGEKVAHEPIADKVYVISALERAEIFITRLSGQDYITLTDFAHNPTKSYCGKPLKAEIINNQNFDKAFNVAYLEDIK